MSSAPPSSVAPGAWAASYPTIPTVLPAPLARHLSIFGTRKESKSRMRLRTLDPLNPLRPGPGSCPSRHPIFMADNLSRPAMPSKTLGNAPDGRFISEIDSSRCQTYRSAGVPAFRLCRAVAHQLHLRGPPYDIPSSSYPWLWGSNSESHLRQC
ncbi:uncharacterized protein BDZ99DRAFT_153118 [Mytilinidion resinicola]|uniref:Uncharacterized protein n=1 Tax=Mytilinidion resinicola TaxID=574789 RepID=A0A6A6Y711_9PEZI|nr:uncharacterized protein BDZ99DRAFT_153118 [Mytilinidion resinicola]KAF2804480.1 hypothetical protein BDZ99DRAFT_153118 [Mytilinidion resinicola]